jgi:PAS domain S-box-containing protein
MDINLDSLSENLRSLPKENLIEEIITLKAEVDSLKILNKRDSATGEKYARIILHEMYQFVALLDIDGNILEVNKPALDGAGIKLKDIKGTDFWKARWWHSSSKVQEQLKRAICEAKEGNFVRYEVEVFGGASGKELIWIDFSLIPVKNENNEIHYLLAEGRNITEKKLAEAEIIRKNEELKVLLEKLKEFDELKTQFFANVSHELRTPLALILGPIRDLMGNKELSEEDRNDLEVVDRNARILLKQVNDLLDIAKLEAGKMTIRFVETDLGNLFRLIASNFENLAREKNISYKIDIPSRLVAEVDPEKMQRVILNLLSNAFKFTPEGGIIRCELQIIEENFRLIVADSGPGIKKENRELIFERFRQLDGGSTRKFGGTGLGLAIVKDFIDMHGGKINASEAPEGGALFLVELPLKAQGDQEVFKGNVLEAGFLEDITTSVIDEIRPEQKTIIKSDKDTSFPLVLIVEDNPDLNQFITKTLSKYYRVASAMDGQEGLEKAELINPDLILSDVMMPIMSGDQMVEALREKPKFDHTPILMLTAKADDNLKIKMLSGGVQDYVVKPFSADELNTRVRNLISVKKAKDTLQNELNSKQEDLAILAHEAIIKKQDLEFALEQLQERELDLEEEVERRKEIQVQLERTIHDLDNFIYTASHDLKAPVLNMEGLLSKLQNNVIGALEDTGQKYFNMIHTSIIRLKNTIDDLTEISKVQKNLDLNIEDLTISDTLDEVICDLECMMEASNAKIIKNLDIDEIQFSRKNFRSILYNLFTNALKYKHPQRDPEIIIMTTYENGYIKLSVKDNGVGFNLDKKDKLFGMFKRLHDHVDGSGIGLYIVKRILENSGGKIDATGQIDKGAEFNLFFPATIQHV